jgi:hypothetical protein
MVFVVGAWSRGVSGWPGGLGLCVRVVFVVAHAGVVFALQASGWQGSDGGFATQCADALPGGGELAGEVAQVGFGCGELLAESVGVSEMA